MPKRKVKPITPFFWSIPPKIETTEDGKKVYKKHKKQGSETKNEN